MTRPLPPSPPAPAALMAAALPHVMVEGRSLPVLIRVSPRSTRLSLRVDPQRERIIVVRPRSVAPREALAFARDRLDWVAARLHSLPPRIDFAAGHTVPLLGTPHLVVHRPEERRRVWVEDGQIVVGGQPEHLARRVRDFLVRRASEEISARAFPLAQSVGRTIRKISIRDARTRWGSCTAGGDLSFSWRLVMAPAEVLSYVVAHEVAHLVEMNHSHHFWAVVQRLAGDCRPARQWLKEHGSHLHRAGPV